MKQAGAKLGKVVREVDPQSLKMYRKGTAGLISLHEQGGVPVASREELPVRAPIPRAEKISGKFYAEHLFDHRGMDGCFPGCNLRCTKGGWVTLISGEDKGRRVWVDGPEYETAAGFGSNLGIWNAGIHHGGQLALRQLRDRHHHRGRHRSPFSWNASSGAI